MIVRIARFPDQAALAAELARVLTAAVPGADVSLRGSLAAGTADEYSDIDLAWVVPDGDVGRCVALLPELPASVADLASARSDPDYQRSALRRLVFVRFRGLPLFWRLDLEVWAVSHAFDEHADVGNPRARGDEWSLA